MSGTEGFAGSRELLAKKLIMRTVAVLCAATPSVYDGMEGVEVYNLARDAWSFKGGMRVIAHPPCRLWGRFSWHACGPESVLCSEIVLGLWCVAQVRRCGGVLEQPEGSRLWDYADLPRASGVDQWWFGHPARKRTWLYWSGVRPGRPPFRLEAAVGLGRRLVGCGHGVRVRRGDLPRGSVLFGKEVREATPRAFAEWLVAQVRG